MGKALWITLGIIAILLLAALYPAMYLYSLNTVEAEDVQISELSFSSQGITFGGTITLRNAGLVEVVVDGVDYTITIANTDEQIGEGHIGGGAIAAGSTADLEFSKTLGWKPSLNGLQELANARTVNMVVSGAASAKFLGMRFTKPFSFTIDVTQHIENYLQQLMQNPFGTLGNALDFS